MSIAVEAEAQGHVIASVICDALHELGFDQSAVEVRRAVGAALRRVVVEREDEPERRARSARYLQDPAGICR